MDRTALDSIILLDDTTLNSATKFLVVRAYSSTQLTILDVKFKSIVTILRSRGETNEKYRKNVELRCQPDSWAVATTHVPRTLCIPIKDDYITNGKLTKLQDEELSENPTLFITVSGKIPELGTDFIEQYKYHLSEDIHFGGFVDIDVNYKDPSEKWQGWNKFDSTES